MRKINKCSIEGCTAKYHAKGFCSKHYAQSPAQKAQRLAYRSRPEVREKQAATARAWYARLDKAGREAVYLRRCEDPEFYAKMRAYSKQYRAKKKKEESASKEQS